MSELFLFLLAYIGLCVLALARHPIFGVMAYTGALYIDVPFRWWGTTGFLNDFRWSVVAGAVTVISLMIHRPQAQEIPLRKQGLFVGLLLFMAWGSINYFWSYDQEEQAKFLGFYVKYVIAIWFIYRSIETEEHLEWFLWTNVFGCFYFGWIAFQTYYGGRFEGFGGAGIREANAGAFTLVLGTFIAASLFLASGWKGRAVLLVFVPFMINGLVTAISRSAFLAMAVGGLVFNVLAPKRYRAMVVVLSVLGLVGFVSLTNENYWARMSSLKARGEKVEGVDTGYGRLVLLRAQWQMFKDHPMGCGSMCTTHLSPAYMDKKYLDPGPDGRRASHNSVMSMLVDFGIPGGIFYGAMLFWLLRSLLRLRRHVAQFPGRMTYFLPGITAGFAAMTVAEQFVPYMRYEIRFWLLTVLMLMLSFAARTERLAGARQDEERAMSAAAAASVPTGRR